MKKKFYTLLKSNEFKKIDHRTICGLFIHFNVIV